MVGRLRIFSEKDINHLTDLITNNTENYGFGIRYFLKRNLLILNFLKSHKEFRKLIFFYFKAPAIIKSIYFDKPKKYNWPVNWHQDITINLESKYEDIRFKNYRELTDRVVVQPNIELLESILTFRIHIDFAGKENGGLSVIENSENEGVIRIDQDYLKSNSGRINLIEIEAGGVMIMSPLTIHSSKRTNGDQSRRRVIHLEIIEKEVIDKLPLIESFEL